MTSEMNSYVARLQEIMASDSTPFQALRDLRIVIQAMGALAHTETVSPPASHEELAVAWELGVLDGQIASGPRKLIPNPYKREL